VATDDSLATNEDTAATLNVLSNDGDVDGDALTVTAVGTAAHGSTVLNGDGTITFIPDADIHAVDTFGYEVTDRQGGIDQATVTVTVAPVNDAPLATDDSVSAKGNVALPVYVLANDVPVAENDSITTSVNTSATVDVLVNDTYPDGDTLTVTAAGTAATSAATLNADGTTTPVPDADYHEIATFPYQVADRQGCMGQAATTVSVAQVCDAPLATDDTVSKTKGVDVTVSPSTTKDESVRTI